MERLIIKILDEKGRVSIPKAIREQVGISLGDVLAIEADPPDCVILTRMEVVEPEETEEPELTDDIFTQKFHMGWKRHERSMLPKTVILKKKAARPRTYGA